MLFRSAAAIVAMVRKPEIKMRLRAWQDSPDAKRFLSANIARNYVAAIGSVER